MSPFTFDEICLMSIYVENGKEQLIENITTALPHMDVDMQQLAQNALTKLSLLSDGIYSEIEPLLQHPI